MPTHFHFIVKIKDEKEESIQKAIGLLLSSYTKAINKRYNRHGSLFQSHTKSKEIIDEQYLLTVITYIHQNPLRAKITNSLEKWKYCSFRSIAKMEFDKLTYTKFYDQYFQNSDKFITYSNEILSTVRKEFWI